MSKISKTVLPCSGDLVAGMTSCMPPVASLLSRFTQLTGGSMFQLQKILRKFFKILGFGSSRGLVWRLIHEWKLQSRGYTKVFMAPFATSSWVDLPIAKNTQTIFFKILALRCLATCPGDLSVTWFSREKCVFCILRTIFKTFQFSLELLWLFIVFPVYTSLKLTVSLSKNHHFCSSFLFNPQEKGMGFLILTKYFMFIALFSWIFELLRFVIYDDSDMGWVRVCWVWVFFFILILGCQIFLISWLIFILEFTDLSCVKHIIPIEICLIDVLNF